MTKGDAVRDRAIEDPGRGSRGRIVVAFHEASAPSGASLSVLRVIPLLESRGWSFAFWASRPSPLFDVVRERGYEVEGVPRLVAFDRGNLRHPPGARARLLSLPGYFRAFRRFVRRQRPVLVHANGLTTVLEALVARTARIPAIVHVHEMLPEGAVGAAWRLGVRLGSIGVVAVSRASAAAWVEAGIRPRIVFEAAAPPPGYRRRSRHDGRLVVGTVGVISRRKGTDLFVEAARRVLQRDQRFEFRLVGQVFPDADAKWGSETLEAARRFGIVHRTVEDIWEELRDWDLFVLPSRWDPFPIALLEAMGAELPVVATRVDGITEQVSEETAVLVPADDPGALADQIIRLAERPEARAAMGRAARQRILDRFTPEHQAAGLHEAYVAAVEGRWADGRDGSSAPAPVGLR
jgi:glycosyltransferase involved in cell wall biosynthesis